MTWISSPSHCSSFPVRVAQDRSLYVLIKRTTNPRRRKISQPGAPGIPPRLQGWKGITCGLGIHLFGIQETNAKREHLLWLSRKELPPGTSLLDGMRVGAAARTTSIGAVRFVSVCIVEAITQGLGMVQLAFPSHEFSMTRDVKRTR